MKDDKMLAIIPARGGSKGLPGKNIKMLCGTPLIAYTIKAALESGCFTKVIVSTDCNEIAKISSEFGAEVPFIRPAKLATDEASSADVVAHALNKLDNSYNSFAILQPTSPFRTALDIRNAFNIYTSTGVTSVVSVCEVDKSPYWCFWRKDDSSLLPILSAENQFARRQEQPSAYALNGAIYIVNTNKFVNSSKFMFDDTKSYVMDKKSSIDIDDIIDFKLAELMLGET